MKKFLLFLILFGQSIFAFDKAFQDRVVQSIKAAWAIDSEKPGAIERAKEIMDLLNNPNDELANRINSISISTSKPGYNTAVAILYTEPDFVEKLLSIPDITKYISPENAGSFFNEVVDRLARGGYVKPMQMLLDAYPEYRDRYSDDLRVAYEKTYYKIADYILQKDDFEKFSLLNQVTLDDVLNYVIDNEDFEDQNDRYKIISKILFAKPELLDSVKTKPVVLGAFADYILKNNDFEKFNLLNQVTLGDILNYVIEGKNYIREYDKYEIISKILFAKPELLDSVETKPVVIGALNKNYSAKEMPANFRAYIFDTFVKENGDSIKDAFSKYFEGNIPFYKQEILIDEFVHKLGVEEVLRAFIQRNYQVDVFKLLTEYSNPKASEMPEVQKYLYDYVINEMQIKDNPIEDQFEFFVRARAVFYGQLGDLGIQAIVNEFVNKIGVEKILEIAIEKDLLIPSLFNNSGIEEFFKDKDNAAAFLNRVGPDQYLGILEEISKYHDEFKNQSDYINLLQAYEEFLKTDRYSSSARDFNSRQDIIQFRQLAEKLLNDYRVEYKVANNPYNNKFVQDIQNIIQESQKQEAIYRQKRTFIDTVKDIFTGNYRDNHTAKLQSILDNKLELSEFRAPMDFR